MFASTGAKDDQEGTKDSVSNIRATGFFCVNIVEFSAQTAMNVSSRALAKHVDEFDVAGLEKVACEGIPCSRVASAPAAMECRLQQIVTLAGEHNVLVVGEVVGVHLRDDCLVDGRFDVTRFQPLARMGYRDYAVVRNVFELGRPDDGSRGD
jgi:flavin reductase (DIM6/NTAB) family NADH-FMN oxidoreductase RutF